MPLHQLEEKAMKNHLHYNPKSSGLRRFLIKDVSIYHFRLFALLQYTHPLVSPDILENLLNTQRLYVEITRLNATSGMFRVQDRKHKECGEMILKQNQVNKEGYKIKRKHVKGSHINLEETMGLFTRYGLWFKLAPR